MNISFSGLLDDDNTEYASISVCNSYLLGCNVNLSCRSSTKKYFRNTCKICV